MNKVRPTYIGLTLIILAWVGLLTIRPFTAEAANTHDHSTWTEWNSTDSLPNGAGSYYLTEDVNIDLLKGNSYSLWEAPAGEYNICLNGHTITVNYTMQIGSGSIFSIYDCKGSGQDGKIILSRDSTLLNVLSGQLTVYDGILEAGKGIAIGQSNSDSVTVIEGGTISGMYSGININSGTVTVNGGTVEGNSDYEYSCGIECSGSNAELIVNSGSISGAEEGLYMVEGTATVNGGTIKGTDAIWCNDMTDSAEVIIKGGIISGESTGIWILGGTVKVEAGTISGNDGGIWCNQDSDDPALVNALEVTGGTISSPSYAIYIDDPDVTVKLSGGPNFSGADADIYLGNNAKITIAGTLTNTDKYSIKMALVGVFTNGDTIYNDPDKFEAAQIHSDNGYAVVKDDDDQLRIDKAFTIIFDYQGATGGNEEESRIILSGSAYGELPVPTKTGYIFRGWFTEDEKPVDAETEVTSDHTLYAKWEKCEHDNITSWDYQDEENHSRKCIDCGATETENHNYGEWTDNKDEETHSGECSECGATIKEKHTYDDGVCTECGAKDPDAADPDDTKPDVTEPSVTEPTVTEPAVTETTPAVTDGYDGFVYPSGGLAPAPAPNSSDIKTITVKVENKVTGETERVRAVKDGENVTVDIGKKNNGCYANIYTSNGDFVIAVLIEKGKAKFTISKDVKFSIIIDSEAYEDDVSADAGVYSDSDIVKDTVPVIGIIVPVSVSLTMILKKKKSVK